MNWSEIRANWVNFRSLLLERFPGLNSNELASPPETRETLVASVAQHLDLTPLEAQEEMEDCFFVAQLARQAEQLNVA